MKGLKRWDGKGGLNSGVFKESGGGSLQPRYCKRFVAWLNDEMTTKVIHKLATEKLKDLHREQFISWHVLHKDNDIINPKRSMP